MSSSRHEDERLLTFEVLGSVYALPIHAILEVAEAKTLGGVPTLPRSHAAVMNWHGDALPVVAARLLVERASEEGAGDGDAADALASDAVEQVLVLSSRGGESASFGLPIDSVLGLVSGSARGSVAAPGQVVVERRQIEGRVVSVLDPRRLAARAQEVIERLAA